MKLTLKQALEFVRTHDGYERCFRKDHGLGQLCIINGVTKPCTFVVCPVVQFYPRPSELYHSWRDFVKAVKQDKRWGVKRPD